MTSRLRTTPIWRYGWARRWSPAGATRIFPEHQVPPHHRPVAAEVVTELDVVDVVFALLDKPVAAIVPALSTLSDEDFARLKLAEHEGKTRKSLIAAMTEDELRRANFRGNSQANRKV